MDPVGYWQRSNDMNLGPAVAPLRWWFQVAQWSLKESSSARTIPQWKGRNALKIGKMHLDLLQHCWGIWSIHEISMVTLCDNLTWEWDGMGILRLWIDYDKFLVREMVSQVRLLPVPRSGWSRLLDANLLRSPANRGQGTGSDSIWYCFLVDSFYDWWRLEGLLDDEVLGIRETLCGWFGRFLKGSGIVGTIVGMVTDTRLVSGHVWNPTCLIRHVELIQPIKISLMTYCCASRKHHKYP